MIVLGLNAYHGDASACLVKDGKVLVAIEEERVVRVKHVAGFPANAIKACLDFTGFRPGDIDIISIAKDPRANLSGRLNKVIKSWRQPVRLLKQVPRILGSTRSLSQQVAHALGTPVNQIKAQEMPVEHHIAHVASAYHYGGFDNAAGVSIDGLGDNLSTLITHCDASEIRKLVSVQFPHSLGFYYTAITQFLGFQHYGDEYKLMGLAAAGRPAYLDQLRQVLAPSDDNLFELNLDFFVHHNEGVEMTWDQGTPEISNLFSSNLIDLLGPARPPDEALEQRHKDIACSTQAVYEEVFEHVLRQARARTGLDTLVLAGGCSQNSLANGRVPQKAGFKRVYVPPSGHDGGTSVGAALFTSIEQGARPTRQRTPYLGSAIDTGQSKAYLKKCNLDYQHVPAPALLEQVIDCIVQGGVVGWVQGRAEWGPRALGNRSILADPRRTDMKQILNTKIKRRESFRPFAPSVPAERGSDWFVLDSVTEHIPYMEKVTPVRVDKADQIPAVVHYDGTARAQLVEREINELYWQLLNTMGAKTGVPILLNTSFNENEPIVERAEDAIDCFRRTGMDMLVIDEIVVTR